MPGAVSGTPGQSYPNRTDLNAQPVRTATGQPYGAAGAQAASQRAVPLPEGDRPLPTPLGAPSSRPGEPLTAGVPFGPGRNTKAINPNVAAPIPPGSREDTLMMLREAYRLYPSDDIMDMIAAEMVRGQ